MEQDNSQWARNSNIDELAFLMFCEANGLTMDEAVVQNTSVEARVMYQNLHTQLTRKQLRYIMMNYIMMMHQEPIEYRQWYEDIHSDEFQKMKDYGDI